MKRLVVGNKVLINSLVILIFTLPASIPLLHRGFFLSDDGEWMLIRLTAFFEALRHGQIPVRFLMRLNNDFGYPLSDFAYPAFLYTGSLIHLLRFNFLDSFKIMLFLSLFLSSIFTFFFLRKKFDNLPSLIGSFVYLYTPYHLFDLYKRGSIGELFAICSIPFIFWQLERRSFFFTALGVFILILAHNSIALICLPFIFLYAILIYKDNLKRNIFNLLGPFVLGVLMSSFFAIPSVYDLRYIVFSGLKIADWHLFFADLGNFGISTIVILTLGIFVVAMKRQRTKINYLFVVIVLFSTLLGTNPGTFIWNIFPSSFIIFPFRFLSILPIGLAFLSALIVSNFKGNLKIVLIILIVGISFYSSRPYLSPAKYLDRYDDFYLNNFATTTANDEYMPKWVREKPLVVTSKKVEVLSGEASVSGLIFNSKKISFTAKADKGSKLLINAIYFPGWNAYVDGVKTNISYQNKNGVMEIDVVSGQHLVMFKFGETGVRLFSDVLSLIGFGLAIGLLAIKKLNVAKFS